MILINLLPTKSHSCNICGGFFVLKNHKTCSLACKQKLKVKTVKACNQRAHKRYAGLSPERKQAIRSRNKELRDIRKLTIPQVLRSRFQSARMRAQERGWEFDITLDFLFSLLEKQGHKCALTGRPFEFSKGRGKARVINALSIDRIDSERGYTQDNVRLVVFGINMALHAWGEGALADLSQDFLYYRAVRASTSSIEMSDREQLLFAGDNSQ